VQAEVITSDGQSFLAEVTVATDIAVKLEKVLSMALETQTTSE
jgi:hypothetical protein